MLYILGKMIYKSLDKAASWGNGDTHACSITGRDRVQWVVLAIGRAVQLKAVDTPLCSTSTDGFVFHKWNFRCKECKAPIRWLLGEQLNLANFEGKDESQGHLIVITKFYPWISVIYMYIKCFKIVSKTKSFETAN